VGFWQKRYIIYTVTNTITVSQFACDEILVSCFEKYLLAIVIEIFFKHEMRFFIKGFIVFQRKICIFF